MGLGWHSGSEGVHSAVCQLLVVILMLTFRGQAKSDHNNSIYSTAGKDHETNSYVTEKGYRFWDRIFISLMERDVLQDITSPHLTTLY